MASVLHLTLRFRKASLKAKKQNKLSSFLICRKRGKKRKRGAKNRKEVASKRCSLT